MRLIFTCSPPAKVGEMVEELTGGKGNPPEIEENSYKFGAIYLWTVGSLSAIRLK